MIRRFVRGLIHNATVTEVGTAWPVAMRIDPILLRAIDVLPLEEVEIVNTATGARFTTWAEAGGEGTGELRLHAAGARKGDLVTIVSHGLLHDGQTLTHKAKVATVDASNRVVALLEQ